MVKHIIIEYHVLVHCSKHLSRLDLYDKSVTIYFNSLIVFFFHHKVSIKTPENHCTGVPMNTTVTTYPSERHSMEHEDVSSNCAVDLIPSSTCGRIKSPEDKIIFGPAFSCADSLTKNVKHEEISVKMKNDEFKLKSLKDQMNAS